MILLKKLSGKEVLEALAKLTVDKLPKDIDGDLELSFDDDGGVEIYFTQRQKKEASYYS